jgi:hypothetical protein
MRTAFVALVTVIVAIPVMAQQGAHERRQVGERSYARTQIKRMERLQVLMEEKLGLTREQEEIFEEMFEEHVDLLKEAGREEQEDSEASAERIGQLRDELAEARRHQDAVLMKELSRQLSELRQGGRAEIDSLNTEFYELVRLELDVDQVKAFNKLVREVSRKSMSKDRQAARMKYKKTSDMMSMINQHCNPSADQKRQMQQRMIEFMSQSMEAVQAGEEDMSELQDTLRQDLLDMLDEEQKRQYLEAEADQIAKETAELQAQKRDSGN